LKLEFLLEFFIGAGILCLQSLYQFDCKCNLKTHTWQQNNIFGKANIFQEGIFAAESMPQ